MSLATIYKTVDILNEIGLINILNVGEDAFRYDANMTSHAHICCTECGRIDDIMMNFDNCVTDVENQSSYDIEKYQFYFYGVCAECKTKKEKVS